MDDPGVILTAADAETATTVTVISPTAAEAEADKPNSPGVVRRVDNLLKASQDNRSVFISVENNNGGAGHPDTGPPKIALDDVTHALRDVIGRDRRPLDHQPEQMFPQCADEV